MVLADQGSDMQCIVFLSEMTEHSKDLFYGMDNAAIKQAFLILWNRQCIPIYICVAG